MGGGGHHHHAPAQAEPAYAKLLAKPSAFCPEGYFYNREIWYIHGGPFCDPKGWRHWTIASLAAIAGCSYLAYQYAVKNEVRTAPKTWVPSLLFNDRYPDPVDFRGRVLDRKTGKPVGADDHGHEEEHH